MKFKNKYLLAIIPLIIVGSILYYFSDIVTYVVLAWVLSMVGSPVVKFLRKYVGKNLAAVATLFLFMLLFFGLIYMFVPVLVQQAKNLAGIDYANVINGLEEPINDWENWLHGDSDNEENQDTLYVDIMPEDVPEPVVVEKMVTLDSIIMGDDTLRNTAIALTIQINNEQASPPASPEIQSGEDLEESMFDKIRENIYKTIDPSRIPRLFSNIIGFFGNIMIALMSIFFIAFFFLREQGLFNNIISSAIPNNLENQTTHAIDESSKLLIRYFTGVLIQVIVITIFVSVLLSVLGIKNALLIGFFAALMNVIPYIGPILGAAFGVIITLSSNLSIPFYDEMLPMLLKVVAAVGIMQLLDNFFLQPNIFSKSVKAHPLEIFIVVLVGAKVGGVAGMVLAIPIYTVLRVIAKVFLSEFKIVQSITREL